MHKRKKEEKENERPSIKTFKIKKYSF